MPSPLESPKALQAGVTMKLRFACLILFLAYVPSAFAWGCAGHETVAVLAERQLNKHAKAQVEVLLAHADLYKGVQRNCPDTQLGKMAYFATWPDDYRALDPKTGPWHYWDIPLLATSIPAATERCQEGCVTQAILDQVAVLKNPNAQPLERAQALAFVIHFVGDLHHPLHSSDNNDRGGTCLPVTVFGVSPVLDAHHPEYGYYRPNLHSAWDNDLLERTAHIQKDAMDAGVLEFSKRLESKYHSQMKSWRKTGIDPVLWAWETHRYALDPAYGHLPVKVAMEQPVAVADCAGHDHVSRRLLALHETIDENYLSAAEPVIEEQIAKAGTRLALILNQVWP